LSSETGIKKSFGNIHNAVLLKQGLLLGIQQKLETTGLLILMGFFVKKRFLRRILIMLFTINIFFGKKGIVPAG